MKCALLLSALLAGCTSVPAVPLAVSGEWGGARVGLHLEVSGGTVDYDCASGTIGPVIPDEAGRFMAKGTHSPGHGGPVRQGEVIPSFDAEYRGTVSGDRMILNVTIEPDTALGPFTLRRGATPELLRCL